jgi:branched-chain amino acid transport system substrate-binding protein
MTVSRRTLIGSAAALPILGAGRARAQGASVLKVGVLTDLSGAYRDVGGPVSTAAAQQAVDEFAGKGFKVEVVQADHQNKTDIGAGIARQWFDRDGVDLIVDVPNSGVGLAIAGVAKDKNKAYMNSGSATSDLTGAMCNANTIHWAYDTYELAKSTGSAAVKSGGDSWFFITADYAFGTALQRDTTEFVTQAGGKVLGSVRYPFPGTTDFSSLLLQAQGSGAKILGLANAGTDTINSIKQAQEFGINKSMKLAGLLVFISDVHALGLEVAQGLLLTNSFYWDANERTRKFSERFKAKAPAVRATMVQAGVYASVLHYLKAAADKGVPFMKADGAAAVAAMKAMPTDDDCFGAGIIRADGRKLTEAYLWEVKKPGESKGPWDYYKLVATTPADQAYRPLDKGGCNLVHA